MARGGAVAIIVCWKEAGSQAVFFKRGNIGQLSILPPSLARGRHVEGPVSL